MHILQGLFNLTKTTSTFTISSLSQILGLNIRSIHYQIDRNLIPLGLVNFVGWIFKKGRRNAYKYKLYELTNLGRNLLETICI